MSASLVLDGSSLTPADVARIARDPSARVEVDPAARERVRRARRPIEAIVARYREDYRAFHAGESDRQPVQDYGITTGFGEFKDVPVPPDQLEELQANLLRSHAAGLGESPDADDPSNLFDPEVVRATLLVRANAFLGGHSGVREELLDTVLAMLHAGVVPRVPIRGSMGSSGDLCPLAHCFVVLVGDGTYELVAEADALRPGARRPLRQAADLADDLADELGALGREAPAIPGIKEGLALINGATLSTALLALAVADIEALVRVADLAGALSLEASCGCARAFDPKVHAARGLVGQQESAAHVRRLLTGSRLLDSAGAVQDAYSLRCAPVVHGAVRDALAFCSDLCRREVNAATDNPLFFAEADGSPSEAWDHEFAANWPAGYDGRARASYSAGNFHGQPIAMASDVLGLAVAELANVSERRSQLLLDRNHNRNLPANLVARRGVQSGLMLAQYAAASVVAENKVLAHPASVDSIPTAANIEDHVAVATTAARKLRQITRNVEGVLAIELMVAAQALDWRLGLGLVPKPGPDDVRPVAAEEGWDRVEAEARRFAEATTPAVREETARRLGHGTAAAYRALREVVPPLLEDRMLEPDIRAVRAIVRDGSLLQAIDEVETGEGA